MPRKPPADVMAAMRDGWTVCSQYDNGRYVVRLADADNKLAHTGVSDDYSKALALALESANKG
jgi:hypothetical protein